MGNLVGEIGKALALKALGGLPAKRYVIEPRRFGEFPTNGPVFSADGFRSSLTANAVG